jgi:hypothetical protein
MSIYNSDLYHGRFLVSQRVAYCIGQFYEVIMARSKITDLTVEQMSDSGSVLWSIVQGEQMEIPINIDFVKSPSSYSYELAVVEALNVAAQTNAPAAVHDTPVIDILNVRYDTFVGVWSASGFYNAGEVVSYQGAAYLCISDDDGYTNATPPDMDLSWVLSSFGRVYVQVPSTLSSNWHQQPDVNSPVYAFVELRVTANYSLVYIETLKPVRGMIEVLFSPTAIAP